MNIALPSPLPNTARHSALLLASLLAIGSASAQTYMDVNGATPGFGDINGSVWNTSNTNWTTNPAGTSATGTWNNANGTTIFSNSTNSSVTVGSNFSVSGLTWDTTGASASRFLTLANNGTTNQSLTIADGGTIGTTNNGAFASGISISNRVSVILSGSATISLGNSAAYVSLATFATTGTTGLQATAGEINVNVGQLRIGGNRTNANTHMTLGSSGSIEVDDNITIGNLNGSGNVISQNSGANRSLTVTQTTSGTLSGFITANTNTGVMNLVKAGSASLVLAGNNAYDGTTTVSAGTLILTGTHTGGDAYTVQSGGTLGGNGAIVTAGNAGVTVASGGKLAPGTSPGVFKMDLGTGSLDISGAITGASTNSLLFELGSLVSSDMIQLTNVGSTLNIGAGLLEFDDFVFTDIAGFAPGTYTLFDTGNTINGALGANLSGTIGGYSATISFANSNQDIILTVAVPEPATTGLAAIGGALVFFGRRRHSR